MSLLDQGSPNPLYQRWINTYGGEEFADIVRAVLALAAELGEGLSGREEEARVAEHFVTTARYEWMFWDMGYRQERWPI
jgi:thiaminase/transcriptional activator TenA